ncbi:MAG: MOSC domain-containing protein [Planctomycetota bacterium]
MNKRGTIKAVCTSTRKGTRKSAVPRAVLVEDYGIRDDVHAGARIRQVSLLCVSSINTMREKGADVGPGDFAENLTIDGLVPDDFHSGDTIRLEKGPVLEVSQIGKQCHSGCEIARQVGDCVMPREGIFAVVKKGGQVMPGDRIEVDNDEE